MSPYKMHRIGYEEFDYHLQSEDFLNALMVPED